MSKNTQHICGAKTRTGTPCRKAPSKGRNRCYLHGGKTPTGTSSARYKHGLYSKYAGESLRKVLKELEDVDTEELIKPESEIRLMSALIMKCKSLEQASDDLDDLDTISKVLERLILAKQRSQKILLDQARLIPASDLQLFFRFLEELLINKVGDRAASDIMNKLQNFRISDYAA